MSCAPPTTSAAAALSRCLTELADVLEGITDADYVARPESGVSGAIGAHVRHCLDHVDALLQPGPGGVVSYDRRRRQAAVEGRRDVAAAALRQAAARLDALSRQADDVMVMLEAQVDRDGARVRVASSVARELVFVMQHTIHHQALVALLLAGRGVAVPHTFGYAPSTPCPAARSAAEPAA